MMALFMNEGIENERGRKVLQTLSEWKRRFSIGMHLRQLHNQSEGDVNYVFVVARIQSNGIYISRDGSDREGFIRFPQRSDIEFTEHGWIRLEKNHKIAEYVWMEEESSGETSIENVKELPSVVTVQDITSDHYGYLISVNEPNPMFPQRDIYLIEHRTWMREGRQVVGLVDKEWEKRGIRGTEYQYEEGTPCRVLRQFQRKRKKMGQS